MVTIHIRATKTKQVAGIGQDLTDEEVKVIELTSSAGSDAPNV